MPVTRDELLAAAKIVNAGSGQRVHEAESAIGTLFGAINELRSLGHVLSVERSDEAPPGEEWPKMLYEQPEKGEEASGRTAVVYTQDEADALEGKWAAMPNGTKPTDTPYPHRRQGGTPEQPLGGASPKALEEAELEGAGAVGEGEEVDANPYSEGTELAGAWLKGFLTEKGAKGAPAQGQGPAASSPSVDDPGTVV